MTLKPCVDCGRDLAPSATRCPGCGARAGALRVAAIRLRYGLLSSASLVGWVALGLLVVAAHYLVKAFS